MGKLRLRRADGSLSIVKEICERGHLCTSCWVDMAGSVDDSVGSCCHKLVAHLWGETFILLEGVDVALCLQKHSSVTFNLKK